MVATCKKSFRCEDLFTCTISYSHLASHLKIQTEPFPRKTFQRFVTVYRTTYSLELHLTDSWDFPQSHLLLLLPTNCWYIKHHYSVANLFHFCSSCFLFIYSLLCLIQIINTYIFLSVKALRFKFCPPKGTLRTSMAHTEWYGGTYKISRRVMNQLIYSLPRKSTEVL